MSAEQEGANKDSALKTIARTLAVLLAVAALMVGATAALRLYQKHIFTEQVKETEEMTNEKSDDEPHYLGQDSDSNENKVDQGEGVVVKGNGETPPYTYIRNHKFTAQTDSDGNLVVKENPKETNPKPQPDAPTEPSEPYEPKENKNTILSLITPIGRLDTSHPYYVTLMTESSYPEDVTSVRYLTSRSSTPIAPTSDNWKTAAVADPGIQLITVSDPVPGDTYIHVLTVQKNGDYNLAVSTPINIALNEEDRLSELTAYHDQLVASESRTLTTDNRLDLDFIQPWIYSNATKTDIIKDLRVLKRAGYKGFILQNTAATSGGSNSDPLRVDTIWYETDALSSYTDDSTNIYPVLDNLMSAAEIVGLDVYLGSAINNEWWTQSNLLDPMWMSNNATFEQDLFADLYQKYSQKPEFKGWYWSPEMYSNPSNLEAQWSVYLNSIIEELDSQQEDFPLIISPYISSALYVSEEQWQPNWDAFIHNTKFRSGDIIALQDGLDTAAITVEEVINRWEIIEHSLSQKPGIKMYLNIENFFNQESNMTATKFANVQKQIEIAQYYADGFLSFSYTHYYSPLHAPEGQITPDPSLDVAYRNFIGLPTNHDQPITSIPMPTGGSVYVDASGNEAPVPAGFSVSDNSNERSIKTGLVIKDIAGNEFVWVPVTDWTVKPEKYVYKENEYNKIFYSRYLGNTAHIDSTDTGSMPGGVASDDTQVRKYSGFYIARYESSFDYNSGNFRVASKARPDSKASTDFSWQYADSDFYTGQMWNNINSVDAKLKASSMASQYGYVGVSSGLMTGTQWDTYLKWVHSNDPSFTMVHDGRTWGNYTDSTSPANTNNYQSGILKATGSNPNWQANNVFDIAGNLGEWTNEIDSSGRYVIRSNSYTGSGSAGNATYGFVSDSYAFPHIGFRVSLYIE